MAGKYQRYPEYKGSGVEWLGSIPSDWNTVGLKRLFKRTKLIGFPEECLLSVYRDHGVVPKSSRDDNNNKPSDDLTPYQLVEPQWLVMNKMKAWQGSIAISEYKGIVSPAYFTFAPLKQNKYRYHGKFIHYLLRTPKYIAQYLRNSKGIRVSQWDLDPEEFQKIECLLPPIREQYTIVNFLDHETAKIDAMIAKQEKLIELLKEKRQAVISHAVTKGLSPNVPMKDSGIEWLGEVPEHWGVLPLKHSCNIFNNKRTPIDRDVRSKIQGEYPYYGPTGILDYLNFFTVEGTYFLLGEDGDHFLKYKEKPMTLVITGKFSVNNHAHLLQASCDLSTKWLANFFETKDLSPWLIRQGVGRYKLRKDLLTVIPVFMPPIDEQREIVSFLETKKLKIDGAIEKAKASLELLAEKKSCLISAAVTGKIDVRNWQPANKEDAYA